MEWWLSYRLLLAKAPVGLFARDRSLPMTETRLQTYNRMAEPLLICPPSVAPDRL